LMNAFNQLEFEKIKDILMKECQSEPGKRTAVYLQPLTDISEICYKLDLTTEIQELLKNNHRFDFSDLTDVKKLFSTIKHDVFSFEEFELIYKNVGLANRIIKAFREVDESPLLKQLLEKIFELPELESEFNRIFTPDGEVKDTASAELDRIRRRSKQLRKNIVSSLNKKAEELANLNLAFDKIVTQRDGRFVIPVKEGTTGHVQGIVHGRSGSGSSVYLEPAEVVQTNNDIHLLKSEEKEEIYRIFQKYTILMLDEKEVILSNLQVLDKLDFYFAAARMSNRYKAEKPVIVDEPILSLMEARHPLLIESFGRIDKVIPFSVKLGKDYRLLIISGPNTGGKTVTLKTVGLLTIMALSGLPIPARVDSRIGLFNNFFADIGDFQSLENSLSTFSSHISNIKKMVNEANERSLIVIDEIGAATDPEQGSALAQAILEDLVSKGVTGIITTHYTSLKLFAEQSEKCINAAMQFDPEKHSPTYQFKLGLPGNSFAIEVASQLGLEPKLIERAKALAGNQNVELTDLLKKIAEQKNELAHHNYQYKLKSTLLGQKIKEYEKKIADFKSEEKSIKKRSLREARDFLVTLQKELNQEISTLKKAEKEKKGSNLKGTLEKVVKINQELQQKEEDLTPITLEPVKTVEKGQKVWVKDFDEVGEVLSIKNDLIKVQINEIQYSTSLQNLYQLDKEIEITEKIKPSIKLPEKQFHFELKLLGYRFDEARPEVEELIDNALVNGLHMVRIVHGKGTGVLRKKIRQYLRGNKKVKEFFTPPNEAGGDGVTVVMLKD
jgi:DNA mismatch repair protein MutS2